MKFADMAELADALDLGSSGKPCRFESCYPHCDGAIDILLRYFYKQTLDNIDGISSEEIK